MEARSASRAILPTSSAKGREYHPVVAAFDSTVYSWFDPFLLDSSDDSEVGNISQLGVTTITQTTPIDFNRTLR